MTTSLTDLLDSLDTAAARLPDHPASRADAGAALGHLGRALTHLKIDGISAEIGDERERRVATLGMLCTGLAARAPVSEGRVATLAAAAADTIGVLRHHTTVPARWAITVEVIDAVANVAEVIERGAGTTPAAVWVAEIHSQTLWAQREAALHPPHQHDSIVVDRALADLTRLQSRDAETLVTAASAGLVHATRTTAPPLSIAAVLAISAACQTLSATAHGLRLSHPDRAYPGRAAPGLYASGRASAGSGDVAGAAQAWQAVRASLQPFHDASTRPLGTLASPAPLRAEPATSPSAVTSARLLHEQLIVLARDPAALTAATVEAIVYATQHLPVIADAIAQNTTAWHTNATVMAFACDLPQRETRLREHLAGYRIEGMVHADRFDLAPVVTAAGNAHLLSAVLAADVARSAETHPVGLPANASPRAGPGTRHLAAANRAVLDAPDSSARIAAAVHDTYAQLQRAERSIGHRRGR